MGALIDKMLTKKKPFSLMFSNILMFLMLAFLLAIGSTYLVNSIKMQYSGDAYEYIVAIDEDGKENIVKVKKDVWAEMITPSDSYTTTINLDRLLGFSETAKIERQNEENVKRLEEERAKKDGIEIETDEDGNIIADIIDVYMNENDESILLKSNVTGKVYTYFRELK